MDSNNPSKRDSGISDLATPTEGTTKNTTPEMSHRGNNYTLSRKI